MWYSTGWSPGWKLNTAATTHQKIFDIVWLDSLIWGQWKYRHNTCFAAFPYHKEYNQAMHLCYYTSTLLLLYTYTRMWCLLLDTVKKQESCSRKYFVSRFSGVSFNIAWFSSKLSSDYVTFSPSRSLSLSPSHRHTYTLSLQCDWSLVTNVQHLIWMFFPGS